MARRADLEPRIETKMKKPYTELIAVRSGASAELRAYVTQQYGNAVLAVCDENTARYAEALRPGAGQIVYPGHVHATDTDAQRVIDAVRAEPSIRALVAVGSGSVHDLTRYAAHALRLPFVSYPTAASVDGFVSGVAAMTIGGVKTTLPATPPVALFADPAVFAHAPKRLMASGIGDIVGKFISLFDWRVGALLTGEVLDEEIYALEEQAIQAVMQADPHTPGYAETVMHALVISGMAIQYMGNSRPASAAEHHCSHLWEMHCINPETGALHGEQVGAATLLILEEYRRLAREGIRYERLPYRFDPDYVRQGFGPLTEGILRENTPSSLDALTSERVASQEDALKEMIAALPETDTLRAYLRSVGAPVTLGELGLPDSDAFVRQTLRWAPYVRNRLTLLKLSDCCR